MKLKDRIEMLGVSRQFRSDLKQTRAASRVRMLETIEGRQWTNNDEDYKKIDKTIKGLESTIRERAVDVYARAVRIFGIDVNKKHWRGVTIKSYAVVEVNPEIVLLEWVRVNLPLLIEEKIDMKMFGALVKAGKIPAGIAWVVKEPRAQIAGKL